MIRALFLRDTPEGGAKKSALPPDRQLGAHLLRPGRMTLAMQVRALCLSPMVDHKCRFKAMMLSVLMFRIGFALRRSCFCVVIAKLRRARVRRSGNAVARCRNHELFWKSVANNLVASLLNACEHVQKNKGAAARG